MDAATTRIAATSLHPGHATGRVLRLTDPLSLWGGTDPDGGIVDPHHPQRGASLAGAVVLLASGRGSSSSTSVLAELIRTGAGPAALVLAEPDAILVVGALVAAELYGVEVPVVQVRPETHRFLPDTGTVSVRADDTQAHLDVPGASIPTPPVAAPEPVVLDADERAMLAGERGEGPALAMRLVVALARAGGATRLLPITRAHVDSCLYHGAASLDWASRLLDAGARVAVPTTSNVGSLDLLHPDLVRGTPDELGQRRALMDAYTALGCRPTFTCAPYQDPTARPTPGEHVAWAESNAIAFVNSVVGARTARYGDLIDVAAAITGRVPAASYHLDDQRRADLVVDVSAVSRRVLAEEAGWGALGLHVGALAGSQVPAIVGAPSPVDDDRLKAFGAGAASSGTVGMFHVVGATPEAPTLEACVRDGEVARVTVSTDDLRAARDRLAPPDTRPLDAVSLGTPHLSVDGFARLAALLGDGRPFDPAVSVYVSTSRAVLERARAAGHAQLVEAAGARIVVDTCTYVTSILAPDVRHAMTDSAKWAWYAPSNVGVTVQLGTLAECVASARAGHVVTDPGGWA